MNFFKKSWEEIKQGENVDLYLTVFVTLLLVTLNILGVMPSSTLNSLSLAILALLAVSILGNRHRLDSLLNNNQIGIDQILHKDYSELTQQEIKKRMENATDLLLIGTDLYGTLQIHYHLLENRSKTGQKTRILLVDPAGSACNTLASRRYRPITPEQYALQVESSLQALVKLKKETSGKLDLRVIDYPIDRGGIFLDINTTNGRLFIWNHGYKSQEAARPKLDLKKSQGYWFEFFCNEATSLWNNSVEWQDEK